jgi:hypothetical protein
MTAGLTLTKEHNIGAMAERFQEGGISALAFDYRCRGSSDGTPRQEANLLQEAEDYRDAVTAAKELPGTDSLAHRLMKFAERKARRTRGRFSGSGDQVSSTQLLGAFCQIAHDGEIQSGAQTQALHASSRNVCPWKCVCHGADNEIDRLTLSTLNGVSDGLDVRSQSTSSLCTEAACNISLQVGRSEGVTPGSTINEVHVISLRG